MKSFLVLCGVLLSFILVTLSEIKEVPDSFKELFVTYKKQHFLDRNGERLNATYNNRYNSIDQVELYELPNLFKEALLVSEDKNFYAHSGVDYRARLNAIWQNIKALKRVRGASTISEQVVKILHPRKRTLWAKWIEGFEAHSLEKKFSKSEILNFYINQVPYGAKRRGIKQAATYYFDRDLETLSEKEMLALIVIIRSPKWYDPFKNLQKLNARIEELAERLYISKTISLLELKNIQKSKLVVSKPKEMINAKHFISYVSSKLNDNAKSKNLVHTTLDINLQGFIQKTLDSKLTALKSKNVHNGGVIVIDHQSNEILAWVSAFAGEKDKKFNSYDPILVRRQPGSTLKPFLYALALQKGWEASTLIDDAPLTEGVGLGMHSYHNYSNKHYGLITLRQALGNSLNIPAVKTIQFVGIESFLNFLQSFAIASLDKHPNYYGDGIALGNSEVTLYELTRAYSTLARMGKYKDFSTLEGESTLAESTQVLPEKVSSLIADILSDPTARAKEFGMNSILNFTHQTAVKTGTSSDYRDAWTIGFDDKYTVGIWFGNLDYQGMKKVTGSTGPAHVLRTVFSYLSKNREEEALYLSDELVKKRECIKFDVTNCKDIDEYYLHDSNSSNISKKLENKLKIISPSKNLILAKDPRIPDDLEYYTFEISQVDDVKKIEWYLNDKLIETSKSFKLEWKVQRGVYKLNVRVFTGENGEMINKVLFSVK